MLAVVRWARERPTLTVALWASLFAVGAFAVTRPVLIVNDGHMYFEMARSMRHGSLEFPNGLDVIDSDELWPMNAAKLGPHVYPKYPPLFGLLAVVPVALFGVTGLYLLNAVAFVVSLLGIDALARRVLAPDRALVATLLVPLTLPLLPYVLMELPHLVALAPLLWALVLWDDARLANDARRAGLLALASGLLVGLSFGVRAQEMVFLAPMLGLGAMHARRPCALGAGTLAGFAICAAAVAAFNVGRFGSANPFSYGPQRSVGSPSPEESLGIFFRPAFLMVVTLGLGAIAAVRTLESRWRWLALPGAALLIAVVPSLAEVGRHTVGTVACLVVNNSVAGAGWNAPERTWGWIEKALLSCAPFLVLGFVAIFLGREKRDPPMNGVFAWMTVVLLVFFSVRDPDPRTPHAAIGFISLNPRYLVEIMPALYLLAWYSLRDVSLGPVHLAMAVFAGLALYVFFRTAGNDDLVPVKAVVITTASITVGAMLVVAYAGRDVRSGALALGPLLALANGYAAACIFAEDAHALRFLAAIDDRAGQRVLAAMKEPEIALVGWLYAKDPIFHLRASKPIVIVDPSADEGATLADTLDALTTHGRTAYYFGFGLEKAEPHWAGRYRLVPVLDDPLLWRLERIGAASLSRPTHR